MYYAYDYCGHDLYISASLEDTINYAEKNDNVFYIYKYADSKEDRGIIWFSELYRNSDYKTKAILRCEMIGVYAFEVKKNFLDYVSYFGSEGFIHVRHNLDTGKETRKEIKTTKREYNYFQG